MCPVCLRKFETIDPVPTDLRLRTEFPGELWGPDGYLVGEVRKMNGCFEIEVKVAISERSIILHHFLTDVLAPMSRTNLGLRYFPSFIDGVLAYIELQGLGDDVWPKIRHIMILVFYYAQGEKF